MSAWPRVIQTSGKQLHWGAAGMHMNCHATQALGSSWEPNMTLLRGVCAPSGPLQCKRKNTSDMPMGNFDVLTIVAAKSSNKSRHLLWKSSKAFDALASQNWPHSRLDGVCSGKRTHLFNWPQIITSLRLSSRRTNLEVTDRKG